MVEIFFLNLGLLSLIWLPSIFVGKIFLLITLLGIAMSFYLKRHFNLFHKLLFLLFFFLLGLGWSLLYVALRPKMPLKYYNIPIWVEGIVLDEPKILHSYFPVRSFTLGIERIFGKPVKRRLKVKLYTSATEIFYKTRYSMRIKIKIPHGYQNLGGYDWEKVCFKENLVGRGEASEIEELGKIALNWREQLLNKNQNFLASYPLGRVILALVLGSSSIIEKEIWQTIHLTGIAYLIAISGLHIAIVANIIDRLVRKLWSLYPQLVNLYPAPCLGEWCGLIFAIFYGYLSGFGVATQRAVINLAVKRLEKSFFLPLNNWLRWEISMAMVLLINPTSSLSISFWLSFLAIAGLILLQSIDYCRSSKNIFYRGYYYLTDQIKINLIFIPLLCYFFYEWPIISIFASLVSNFWWSFLIIPLAIFSELVFIVWGKGGELLFRLTHYLLQPNWFILKKLTSFSWNLNWPIANLTEFFSLEIAILLLILPWKSLKSVGISWLLVLRLVNSSPLLKFTILDVGQGLAVLIQTPKHSLLYDTGPSLGNSNAGEKIICPFLKTQKINKLDKVIISHGDDDHRGGLVGLLGKVEMEEVISSEPEKISEVIVRPCKGEERWVWEGVQFHLFQAKGNLKSNDLSCILKITCGQEGFLLPGDLEKKGEKALIKQNIALKSKILVAPHHGSKGAADPLFLKRVDPEIVFFPVGYKNRFRFPHPEVFKNFSPKTKFYETGKTGAIEVVVSKNKRKISTYREKYPHYWMDFYRKMEEKLTKSN